VCYITANVAVTHIPQRQYRTSGRTPKLEAARFRAAVAPPAGLDVLDDAARTINQFTS
jgi:hypothetical protein